jgi:oxaloacetate decarboxylase (Na+ extruding) subunit alpha
MSVIKLIDTTLRDGNQSLWGATGLTTGMMLQIAPVMSRARFHAIDFTTSTHMAVAARFQKENPWERIRLMAAAMPETPLSFLTTGMRFISWEAANPDLMEFAFGLLVKAGIRRFAIMDPMNDTSAMTRMAGLAAKAGVGDILAAITYTVSPIHDDAHFASKAKTLAKCKSFTGLYLKDPGGLLTPERARTIIPALKAQTGKLPLELHSHSTIGLAQFSYLEAAALGASALHVAARPLANGTSQPPAAQTVANLRDLGHTVDIDDSAIAEMDAYFAALALAEGLECGRPQEFDRSYFRHQMPGGMIGTMKRQLSETKRLHLFPQVLEETERVRAELGYPIMVTPLSQVVGTQALMNVVSGKRYETVPDEVMNYVLGRFGTPTMPIDGAVEDRIRSSPRAKVLAEQKTMPELSELRAKIGRNLPDEEFLLRATMPAEQVDAMLAAGPAKRTYASETKAIKTLVTELAKRTDLNSIAIEKAGVKIALSRHGARRS